MQGVNDLLIIPCGSTVAMRDLKRCRDGLAGAVFSQFQCDVGDSLNGDARNKCRCNAGGEDPGGLQPIALLMPLGEINGFLVSCLRVAGINSSDGGGIHGCAAVHHIAHAALARIAGGQLQTMEDPFFRIKQALNNQRFPIQFRHPARFPGNLPHKRLPHIPRINVTAQLAVNLHQAECHQRIVGDDTVAAYAVVAPCGRLVHPVPALVDGGDAAIFLRDLPGGEFLNRSA
ncbi:Uncharacterised protein [Enterobacter cloacae]|nr:Uncharacterised protein [Enterobacter cloacae]